MQMPKNKDRIFCPSSTRRMSTAAKIADHQLRGLEHTRTPIGAPILRINPIGIHVVELESRIVRHTDHHRARLHVSEQMVLRRGQTFDRQFPPPGVCALIAGTERRQSGKAFFFHCRDLHTQLRGVPDDPRTPRQRRISPAGLDSIRGIDDQRGDILTFQRTTRVCPKRRKINGLLDRRNRDRASRFGRRRPFLEQRVGLARTAPADEHSRREYGDGHEPGETGFHHPRLIPKHSLITCSPPHRRPF
ncbi:hypothetical protein AORI_0982 [Amycolatopsis keratiniphila]|uniref:Uncharacterized protein n=1 Tax=Amycolatopsis keratiniphila TaxID=129921 RepID=R4STT5_9PSEU|nr:hypothetical protein AORI_0982 [Amycolatopsis keratiniphila]